MADLTVRGSARLAFLLIISGYFLITNVNAQIKQTAEVIKAYDACRRFERIMSKDLDFAAAFQAVYTKDLSKQRALAIADGEFGDQDFNGVSDTLLVEAYQQRMQIFYLTIVLASVKDEAPVSLFPTEIESILKRQAPSNGQDFAAYLVQLKQDAALIRSHLERSAASYPVIAEGIRKFKTELFKAKIKLPTDYKIEPSRNYYRSSILDKNEEFYEINGYTVIKERNEMRIVGIKFFTRLF